MMARVAAEPQSSREVEVDDPARDWASMMSAPRNMKRMVPREPSHVSGGETKLKWNENYSAR